MKLSLFFLVCCFLATTFGQNIFYWPYVPYGGAQQHPGASSNSRSGARFWPRYYQQYLNQPESSFTNDFEDNSGEDEEVNGRSKYQMRLGVRNRHPINNFNQKQNVENRQVLRTITPVVSVVTVYSTTTTITSTSTSSCIPSTAFNINTAGGKLSTNACRRKRDALEVLERIAPTSNINQIETTPLTEEQEVLSRIQRDVESSQDSWADLSSQNDFQPRFGFIALNSILTGLLSGSTTPTITQTITIPTSFAITSTTIPKTLVLLNPAPAAAQADVAAAGGNPAISKGQITAGINCLPAGVGVC